jgi:uncharacterized protein GlcG (DUF336 family)
MGGFDDVESVPDSCGDRLDDLRPGVRAAAAGAADVRAGDRARAGQEGGHAAEAEAKKNNWLMAIAVVSPSGDLAYFRKLDGTQYASIQIAQHKAKAAATFRRPTKAFQDGLAQGNTFLLTLDGVIASEGGVPIVVGGKIIGAIGCSGGTGAQDGQVCQAGVNALK